MVPQQEEDHDWFAFLWQGQQYTFTHICKSYKHSPTLAHHALAQELVQISMEPGVKVYQYIYDVLRGGNQPTPVQVTQERIIPHLRVFRASDTCRKNTKPC